MKYICNCCHYLTEENEIIKTDYGNKLICTDCFELMRKGEKGIPFSFRLYKKRGIDGEAY